MGRPELSAARRRRRRKVSPLASNEIEHTSSKSERCCCRPSKASARATIIIIISLLVDCCLCLAATPSTTPSSQEQQQAQLMSKLLKSMQMSACDGEIMRIRCRDDYAIEVLTAEQTILPLLPASATGNSVNKGTQVIHSRPLSAAAAAAAAAAAGDAAQSSADMSQYCPPISSNNNPNQPPPLIEQPQQLSGRLLAANSNGTGNAQSAAAATQQQQQQQPCSAEEATRKALSRETFVKFVRSECQSRNSCQLDLRRSANQTSEANQAAAEAGKAASAAAAGGGISRAFNEICPANRKLAEVIYKCRPQKLTKRTACRGAQLSLECPPDKRLVFAWASYGAWANDTRTHERCSPASRDEPQQQPQLEAGNANGSQAAQLAEAQQQQLTRNCLANETFAVLAGACAFRESCSLQVEPAVLGQTNCPVGQAEYLRVVFTCVNETLIAARSSSSAPVGGTYSPATTIMSSRARSISAGGSSAPSTSASAGAAHVPSTAASAQPNQQQQQQQQQQNQKLIVVAAATAESANQEPDGQLGGGLLSVGPEFGESGFTLVQDEAVSSQQLGSAAAAANRPARNSATSGGNQAGNLLERLVAARYPQLPLAAIGCLSLAIVLVLAAMGCSRRRATSAAAASAAASSSDSSVDGSSKDSKDSSLGKSSATSGFKSLGSTAGLMQNSGPAGAGYGSAAGAGHHLAALKHHSFSESCFSLDEADFAAADSPGLPPAPSYLDTCVDFAAPYQAQYHQAAATVRPKLWAIHDPHQQQQRHNSLRSSLSQAAQQQQHHANGVGLSNTLRSHTRTFVGQQAALSYNTQLQQQHQHHHHHQPQVQQQPAAGGQQQFAYQQLGAVSNAADLLLAMATNHHAHQQQLDSHQQQQQRQRQPAPGELAAPAPANWCATLAHGRPDDAVADHLAVLMPAPPLAAAVESQAALLQPQQAQPEQQQQQQQLTFQQ